MGVGKDHSGTGHIHLSEGSSGSLFKNAANNDTGKATYGLSISASSGQTVTYYTAGSPYAFGGSPYVYA